MIYKILKIDYRVENIANYVFSYSTEFESFPAIMSCLMLDEKKGVGDVSKHFYWPINE